MLAILGFVLYGILALAVVTVDTIGGMIDQALILAFELSVGMFALYFYPLILAGVLFGLKLREPKHRDLLSKQTNIAASVAVSLGLIGTFQGLTAMVSSIAASMGGEGDITEKMGAMINAISDALNAMSYAFLTSILGVAVSVLLILSLNFWMFGFKKEAEEKKEEQVEEKPKDDSAEVLKLVARQLAVIMEKNQQNADAFTQFVKSQDQTMLVNTLNTFVEVQRDVANQLQTSTSELGSLVNALQAQHGNRADELALAIINELSKVEQANTSLLARVDNLGQVIVSKMDAANETTIQNSNAQRELISAVTGNIEQQKQRMQALMQALI